MHGYRDLESGQLLNESLVKQSVFRAFPVDKGEAGKGAR